MAHPDSANASRRVYIAHRLLHWAQGTGKQQALKHALFNANFADNADVSDQEVLATVRYADEVGAAEKLWMSRGIHAVPGIVINGQWLISGGQPPETFERTLRGIADELASAGKRGQTAGLHPANAAGYDALSRGGYMNRLKLLAAGLTLLGIAHAAEPNPAAVELTLVDMQGQKKVLGTLPDSATAPRISPAGNRVAFQLADASSPATGPQATQLYVAQLDKLDQRHALQPTLLSTRNLAPVWSADGDWIAFVSSGNGSDSLFRQRADGSIQPGYLVDGRAPEGLYKGGLLAFITLQGDRDYGISLLDINTRKVTRFDQPGSAQHSSSISPDGRWIAYTSDETGRQEVWVEPLPQTGKRFQLTRQGGRHPQWSPDGSKLYYDQDGKMFRMDVSLAAEASRASEPVALPITGFQQGDLRRQYDLMPDGKGFVMLFPARTAQ